jgi:hypothetical protein
VSRHIWPTAGLFTLGFGAALVAVLGPLVTEAIRYHVSDGAANQVLDGDIAGLVLVAPMSLLAGVLVWRGHGAGPILALGPAFYALYMYIQLALGGDFFRYEGNSELYFPVFPLLIDKISPDTLAHQRETVPIEYRPARILSVGGKPAKG